jgi:isocitrate dehydrogenase kinase/phosphatase
MISMTDIDQQMQEANDVQTINKLIGQLTDKLNNTIGTVCEVYSRIVGYYRNTANWNIGKSEEFKERVPFIVPDKIEIRDEEHTQIIYGIGA